MLSSPMPKGTLSWNMRPYRLAFALGLALTLLMAIPGHVAAEEVSPQIPNQLTSELEDGMPPFLKCPDQTYALCAASSCYVYDDVAFTDIFAIDAIEKSWKKLAGGRNLRRPRSSKSQFVAFSVSLTLVALIFLAKAD